jgi:hypothetical protein
VGENINKEEGWRDEKRFSPTLGNLQQKGWYLCSPWTEYMIGWRKNTNPLGSSESKLQSARVF